MTAWQVAGFLLCVAVASCTQSITGFALALILLGLCGLFGLASLPDVANVATVLSLASAAIALRGARRSVDWQALRATTAGTLLGVPAGVVLLAWLHANVVMLLRLLLGLVVIACAIVVLLRSEPLARRSSRASFGAIGVLSGLLGGLFSASGPPLVWQFYRQPMDIDAVRDTLVAILAAGASLRLAMVVASGQFTGQSLALCAMAVPLAMGITWWMRLHPPAWRRETVLKIVCALLVVTGAGLVGPALRALLSDPMITWQTLAFLLCVALATAAQGITGFALVLVLLGLTGVFDLASLPDAANVATVLGLANAAVALRGRHHKLDRTVLQPTAIGTLAGVAMGVALLAWLNANVVVLLRLLLGVLVIASAVLVLRKAEPLPQRSSTGSFYVAGLLSGVLGGLFSAGGPPLVWQFYRQPMTLQAVRESMVALFALGSVLRLAFVVPSGQFTPHALLLTLLAVPVVVAVTWWLKHHPPAWDREAVLKVVCALLALTGVGLIAPALHTLW